MRRLLIRPGAIGDCLCWLPTLAALAGDECEVWASTAVLPLMGLAQSSRSLASSGFSLLGIPGLDVPERTVDVLRDFDEILSWSGGNQPDLQAVCQSLGLPITFFQALPDPSSSEHVSDFFLRQTRDWHGFNAEPEQSLEPGGRRPLLPFLQDAPRVAHALRPRVVFHPYSGSPAKNWPIERFRALAASLGAIADIQWCASPEDPLPGDLAQSALRFHDLRSLAIALDGASLFVGNDSGITHLAATLGIPCVVFFGPMNPAVWTPRGASVSVVRTAEIGQPAAAIPFETAEALVHSRIREL